MIGNLVAVICVTRTICLRVGNFIIKITSRRVFGKLLLELPSTLFPKYRVTITSMLIEHNKKMRQSTGYQSDRNTTTDYTTDDESETILGMAQESQRLEEIRNLILSPPLRRITAQDLNSIKLRKCEDLPEGKNNYSSEISDLQAILRRRFAVIHSPYGSETETDFDDDADYFNCSLVVEKFVN
ncbi:uncharacterized protein LOC130897397 [Diorhabda carinulata]|uniref:uncharacterized protein LOC130897397 n=1 Tax=Diorhabda carinulata TaxID=1163345 RepID=UPI0025A2989D|nr:uncharacterized protein LOC130897397 [Diorhabda carinulata]